MGRDWVMYEMLTDEKIKFQACIFPKQINHDFSLIFDHEGATGKGVVRLWFQYQ